MQLQFAMPRKKPAAKKLVFVGTVLIGLVMIAQAQQTEGERSEAALSEMMRVTTLCNQITERLKRTDVSDAQAVMETCQNLLAKLDDAYRTTMTYGDARLKSEAQRWYINTRQILLDNLVNAQNRLATESAHASSTPSPIEVATPPDTGSTMYSLIEKRHAETIKQNALAYSETLIPYLKQNYSKPNTLGEKWAIRKMITDEALRVSTETNDTALFGDIVRDQIYDRLGWSLNW
jgi:hypothetical protein